ncbi:hypothetical protein K7472_16815 [Streptomyces sp. PTM05]|uniref:CHAD domain-containing protein n=1 Tax=Streptantibioticus parmotrematis TaxID=2873249 RepID=A0ABS7QVZ3_9ACTN|nr:hypothetical protein [Streptantibioticus parmotrematis]MBY8886515.1 hypothetical protein [Streptantibioticus parmotrematis]
MAVAGSTGPVMSREEVDRALARLASEHEAIEVSLLALQDHAGRRLLEGTALSGLTKERWASVEPVIPALWDHFEVYGAALRAARELRGDRRWPPSGDLAGLTETLRGAGVTVPGGVLPDVGHDAPGDPVLLAEPTGLERLAERMNDWYAEVIAVVTAADAVWSALPARVDLLSAEARRVESLARSVGVRPSEHPAGDDLEELTAELAALRAEVVADPLAFWLPAKGRRAGGGRPDTRRYERAERELEDIRREVEAVLHVREDAEHRLMRLRDVLSRADRTLTEARSARGEVLARIAGSVVPAVSGPSAALHERLAVAVGYHRAGHWHRLSPLLDDLEEHADDELQRARASLTAVTAPLAVRAELRGRLDAYKARAARHGTADDPLLVERYDQARRLLWSAPCDLRAAEGAVLRFQQAVAEALAPAAEGAADGGGSGG